MKKTKKKDVKVRAARKDVQMANGGTVVHTKKKIDAPVDVDTPVDVDEPKEKAFEPPTISIRGVEHKCLTEVDLLRLELLHAQIQAVANGSRAKTLEAEKFEQEAIMKLRKLRMYARDLGQEHIELNDKKMRFLGTLTDKYGVDFKNPQTTYDDETGAIIIIEEPIDRQKKKAEAEAKV